MDFKNMSLNAIEKEGYRLYNTAGRNKDLWQKCADCFIYLIEHGSRDDKKAQYGNTLGYIYYYGRTNDYNPEYDKAFEYFSIGAEGGFYESLYKLGDMYLNGYYVDENPEMAVKLYLAVYEDVEQQFRDEVFEGVFADISLRLGSLYRMGIGCKQDDHKALFIYTMADYAIKERMKHEEFFGNRKVAASIASELSELQKKLGVDTSVDVIKEEYPQVLPIMFSDGYIANMTFSRGGDKVIIQAERISPFDDIYDTPRVPVIFSEYGYLAFYDMLIETAVGVTEFELLSTHEDNNYIDEIRYDDKGNRYEFCFEGEIVAAIKAKEFVFEFDRK